ncbi:MAG: DUF456 domain-containing protein [Anaerolineales bacterium]|nr:DUF456 domain-containing protein [Anaerolineales bacterium]
MVPWLNISSFALTQLFMLIGLLGLIVPVYPGLVVMWLAALGYGIVAGFETLGEANAAGIVIFVVQSVLALAGTLVDNLLLGVGARKGGASWRTIAVALGAGVLGTIIFPPIGGIIAAPLAVLLLEYGRVQDWQKAWEALRGLATGWGLAYIVRLGIGFLIMALWWIWVWIS